MKTRRCIKTSLKDVPAYETKDGSIVRELMHPLACGNANQSLAEATVSAGAKTRLHRHEVSEEIYHVISGRGVMTLGEEDFEVHAGDTIYIAAATAHMLENTGDESLIVLCACAPAYSHEDTVVLD
jgi:mannose-6-phosphate isomerase-like protein (cupin superfamily)